MSRIFERGFGALLACYPSAFRSEYGAEMRRMFQEECRIARQRRGLGGVLAVAVHTLIDVVRTAPREHAEIFWQDVAHALRVFRRNPGFVVAATLTLALGIGANTAIFSLVEGIILKPLPFPEADRLVMIWERNPRGIDRNLVSPPNFTDLESQAKSFTRMAAFYDDNFALSGRGDPDRLRGYRVSPAFFDVLRTVPALGAGFNGARAIGADPSAAVVISHGLWQRRFGGDSTIIGTHIVLDGAAATVVGVMPRGFAFPSPDSDVWAPIPFDLATFSRQARFLTVVGRLRATATLAQASAELGAVAARLARDYPDSNRNWAVTTDWLKAHVLGRTQRTLFLLFGAVGLVLLIACANVANLLLARGTNRQKEMAIRTMLGAKAQRIFRQLVTESLVLAALGAAVALAVAYGGVRLFRSLYPGELPRLGEVAVDGWVVAFTAVVALSTGLVCGLFPARQAASRRLQAAVGEHAWSTPTVVRHPLRGLLVTSQVALAVLLLIGAGLVVRSVIRLQTLDPGFAAQRVLTLNVTLPVSRYPTAERRLAFLDQTVEKLRALRGVDDAAMITTLPLTGGEGFNRFGFTIDGTAASQPGANNRFYARWITADYFKTMGIPLLKGRDFTERDAAGASPIVIIDATLARRFFPNEDPIGRFIRTSYAASVKREIVGVVGDVRQVAIDREPAPQIYIPARQEFRSPSMAFVVRTGHDPRALVNEARRAIGTVDADQPVYDVRPMAALVSESIGDRRLNMELLGLLAGVALILTALGIYGVVSYSVGRRVREVGVRIALGASRVDVVGLVLTDGMKFVLPGVVLGGLAARFLSTTLTSLLYEVGPADPWTYATVMVMATFVALLACLVPAIRATRVDPVIALRAE